MQTLRPNHPAAPMPQRSVARQLGFGTASAPTESTPVGAGSEYFREGRLMLGERQKQPFTEISTTPCRARRAKDQPMELTCDEQWLLVHQSRAFSPEKRLFAALLEDATWTLRRPGGGRLVRENYESCLEWLSAPDTDYIFSFKSVCEALGFDPARTRSALLQQNGNGKMRRSRHTCTVLNFHEQ